MPAPYWEDPDTGLQLYHGDMREVLPAPADRAAEWRAAADHLAAVNPDWGVDFSDGVDWAVDELRARADEAAAGRVADDTQPETRTSCPDPIECGHEAALGQAEEKLARLREWATSDAVIARTEFGEGYRACQRDIRDLIDGRIGPAVGGAQQQEEHGDRVVAYVLTVRTDLHCLRCTPTPVGDIWTPVTADELEDGGICTACGVDVLIPQERPQ